MLLEDFGKDKSCLRSSFRRFIQPRSKWNEAFSLIVLIRQESPFVQLLQSDCLNGVPPHLLLHCLSKLSLTTRYRDSGLTGGMYASGTG